MAFGVLALIIAFGISGYLDGYRRGVVEGRRAEQRVVVVPVRIRVVARFVSAGGDFGYMKFQTTPRSWVIIAIPQVNTFAEYTTTGWLESTAAPDDDVPVLADFAKVENGTMEILDERA